LDIEKGIFIGNIMKYRKLEFKPTRLVTINYHKWYLNQPSSVIKCGWREIHEENKEKPRNRWESHRSKWQTFQRATFHNSPVKYVIYIYIYRIYIILYIICIHIILSSMASLKSLLSCFDKQPFFSHEFIAAECYGTPHEQRSSGRRDQLGCAGFPGQQQHLGAGQGWRQGCWENWILVVVDICCYGTAWSSPESGGLDRSRYPLVN
jgi:hypothetical protein